MLQATGIENSLLTYLVVTSVPTRKYEALRHSTSQS